MRPVMNPTGRVTWEQARGRSPEGDSVSYLIMRMPIWLTRFLSKYALCFISLEYFLRYHVDYFVDHIFGCYGNSLKIIDLPAVISVFLLVNFYRASQNISIPFFI